MVKKIQQKANILESISVKITNWIGTPYSIVAHTLLFLGIFLLKFLGVNIADILLILTTAVSLEAIYLAIFIQMTVNRNTASLESVEDEIEEISEEVEDLSEEFEDISEDLEEDDSEEEQTKQALQNIELQLEKIHSSLETLKKKGLL